MHDTLRSNFISSAVTVWGRANSLNVQRVLFCVADLAIPHQHVPAGGQSAGLDTPAFLCLNPNRLVPVIQDGEFVIWESNVIVRYLCRAYGQPAGNARDIALQERWMDWYGTEIGSHMTALWGHTKRGKLLVPEVIDHHWGRAAALWKIVAEQLEDQDFIGGKNPSVADYALGPAIHRWQDMSPPDGLPESLSRWHTALSARHSYQTYVQNAPL